MDREAAAVVTVVAEAGVTKSRKSRGENMPLRMRVHDREPIGLALRRFKKLLERSCLTKELRRLYHDG